MKKKVFLDYFRKNSCTKIIRKKSYHDQPHFLVAVEGTTVRRRQSRRARRKKWFYVKTS